MQYLVIIEKGDHGYGAYCPDLPGVVAAADTVDEVKQLMRKAMEMHIQGMIEDGEALPPSSDYDVFQVPQAS